MNKQSNTAGSWRQWLLSFSFTHTSYSVWMLSRTGRKRGKPLISVCSIGAFVVFQSVLGTVYLPVLDSLAGDSATVKIHKPVKKTCSF